jgi:hypothetical protein
MPMQRYGLPLLMIALAAIALITVAFGQDAFAAVTSSALVMGAVTQPGGAYKVGDRILDAEGNETTLQKKSKESAESSSGFDAEKATRAELEAEAARRGVTVTRSDGKDGDPLVEDFRAALK